MNLRLSIAPLILFASLDLDATSDCSSCIAPWLAVAIAMQRWGMLVTRPAA